MSPRDSMTREAASPERRAALGWAARVAPAVLLPALPGCLLEDSARAAQPPAASAGAAPASGVRLTATPPPAAAAVPTLAARPASASTPASGSASAPTAATPVRTLDPALRGKAPIFVLNSLDATVSVIDPATFTEQRRISVGKEPHHLYLTPDEKSLIVANAAGNSLTFIDPRDGQIQRQVRDIVDPYHLRFSPDMKWFITASNRIDHIDLYRWHPQSADKPFELVKRLSAPKTPSHLYTDSKSTVVYGSLQDSDELIAIDLNTQSVRWKIPVGHQPADVFLTRDDRLLLVGLTGDRVVEVYDVSLPEPKLVKRIDTGAGAHAFRSRGDGKHLFVSNRVADTISIIDLTTLTVAGQIRAPGGPDCMDVTADGKRIYLSSRWARKMTVIDVDTGRIVTQVPVGRSPHGVWTLDHAPRN